jgi:hypothetical protein
MDNTTELVQIIMDKIETALQIKPEWNYYNAAENTAQLEGEWLERANALFGLAATAATDTTATAATAAAIPVEEVEPIIRKQKVPYKHTRRVHGRRALTPPRSNRPTAITRSSTKSPHK